MEEGKEILYLHEAERRRISEALHDTTVQELVCLSQRLELALLYMERDPVQARLEILSSRRYAKHIINGIRDIIYDLHPVRFDEIGWERSIAHLYDILTCNQGNVGIFFDVDNPRNDDGVTEISLYRIICEACGNVLKHAQAQNMWVSMKTGEDGICLRIKDDGIGFLQENQDRHFGMKFMRERVLLLSGRMHVNTGRGGTEILIDIPITRQEEAFLPEFDSDCMFTVF